MGIHRLFHSSCCFLNTKNAITRKLIRTARTLKAEWWQVWGEAWVRGQRKLRQVLGAFGLLDFTTLRPVLAWGEFWDLWTVYFFNFPNFFGQQQTADNRNRGYGGPPVFGNPWLWNNWEQICRKLINGNWGCLSISSVFSSLSNSHKLHFKNYFIYQH